MIIDYSAWRGVAQKAQMSLLIDALGVRSIKGVWLKSIVQTTGILSYLSTDTVTSQMLWRVLRILISVLFFFFETGCFKVFLLKTWIDVLIRAHVRDVSRGYSKNNLNLCTLFESFKMYDDDTPPPSPPPPPPPSILIC